MDKRIVLWYDRINRRERRCTRAEENCAKARRNEKGVEMKSVKILGIANSFGEDCMEYVYDILKSLGVENVKVAYLCYPGCSVKIHCNHARNDMPNYRLSVKEGGVWTHVHGVALKSALEEEWDYIFTQQCCSESGLRDRYDDLDTLMAYIRAHAKGKPIYGWQMTWTYAQCASNENFAFYNNDQMEMYRRIVATLQEKILPRKDISRIFPTGTAVQNARTALGDTLNRDDLHLDLKIGRYIAGLCVVKGLLGLDIDGVGYAPEGVGEKQKEVAIKAVNAACTKPFEVTQID